VIHGLRIHGLGVIEDAVVPFAPGLTVLTGETGAGKTMVLTGLGLLRGDKADPAMVRSGVDRADIDGEWLLDESDSELRDLLDEVGARVDDHDGSAVLVLGRSVAAEGRSRAFAGGRSVPSAALAEICDRLIAVHGQSDQLLLRDPRRQRDLVDRFAGEAHASALVEYRAAFGQWRRVQRERAELLTTRQDKEREAELLRMGIEEIAVVQPELDEDERLKAQAAVLAHAADLSIDVAAAHDGLVGGEAGGDGASVMDTLVQARRLVERAASLDPDLEAHVVRIDAVMASVADLAADLGTYARDIDADPQQLARVEQRRQEISSIKRKYGPGLSDVLEWWSRAELSVREADGADERLEQLVREEEKLAGQVRVLAERISAGRRDSADRLSADVTSELNELAMAESQLRIDVATTEEPESLTADGADEVTMQLRPHAGSDFRPLGKGASGGELSRIMLGIEVVLAGAVTVPTFVFDEVDAGIGGKVAVEVGRRLARLARSAQVVVVTHLPQVAAYADLHVVVTKGTDGRITAASVMPVEGDARVAELVRMLSGLEGSVSGAEHAAELLALALKERGA